MLSVHGFFVIPSDPQIKEFQTQSGTYISFQAAGEGKDKNNEPQFHMYQISLWVSNDKLEKWRKLIIPKKVFYLKSGDLVAPINGDKIGFTQIKTTMHNLQSMANKFWFEKEDK